MKIIYSKKFQNSLANIVDFIAQDSPKRAREFATNLKSKIALYQNTARILVFSKF